MKYRKAVEELVREDEDDIDFLNGEFDCINRRCLNEWQRKLGIAADEAAEIEREVMEPLRQRQQKLQQYEEALAEAVKWRGGALREADWRKLERLLAVLELRDEDVEPIVANLKARIAPPPKPQPEPEPQPVPQPEPKSTQASSSKRVEVELKSAKGADYTQLRDLLKAQKWQEADQETSRLMLQVANRTKERWLDVDSINNFPCEDLRTIDQLWVHYSNGHFGFSVQKRIWEECGGKVDYETGLFL